MSGHTPAAAGPASTTDGPAPRSLLFVPASRPDRFERAVHSGADAVIVDLEDSVPHAAKATARSALAAWLGTSPPPGVWVRVNPVGSADLAADLRLCANAAGLAGLVLPKAERAVDLDRVADVVGPQVRVLALVETARGLLRAEELANHPSVDLLAFGNLDFAADCGMDVTDPDEVELLGVRTQLVVASRAAGLPGPIDGVTVDVRDPERTRKDAARAARLGFSGKLCVHPSQVAAAHEGFRPSESELAWAREVLDRVRDGVGVVDGAMVDRPVLLRAQRLLRRG